MRDRAAPRPSSGMKTLLGGLFDHAGMFPPASLAFEEALRTAAGFKETLQRPWLVGAEAVVPFERLADMTPEFLLECGFPSPRHVRVALLGTLDVPEVTTETTPVSWEARIGEWDPEAIRQAAASAGRQGMRLYVEPAWSPQEWIEGAGTLAAKLSSLGRQTSGPGAGLKVRGSGEQAIDPPALAAAIEAVCAAKVAFKATAGLHHPLIEPERHGNTLGFLGLVTALRLRQILGPEAFGRNEIQACLGAADPEEFEFEENGGVGWRDFAVSRVELAGAARALPFSIGSCSLHEPDADLTRLFLL